MNDRSAPMPVPEHGSTSFMPSLPAGSGGAPDPALVPLWRRLGADSCRAVLVEMRTHAPLASRWMSDWGLAGGSGSDQSLENTVPGVGQLLAGLAEGDPQRVHARMLSPRRWVYVWLLDERIALVAQVHHVEGRSAASDFDVAAVRLVCDRWLATEIEASGVGRRTSEGWNQVERRARGSLAPRLTVALVCLALCALVGLWLTTAGASLVDRRLAAQQAELQRLGEVNDSVLVSSLANTLMGGDYGELQESLSQHALIGHFGAAVVSNARGQVVAQSGVTPRLPVGTAVPQALQTSARMLSVAAGGQELGRLYLVAGGGGPASPGVAGWSVRSAGVLVLLMALAGAAALWSHARRGDR